MAFNSVNECHTVVSKDELIKRLSENDAFRLDGIEAAIQYLHCQQKLSIQKTQIDKQEVILYKFAVAWNCNVEPITPLDISIYTLNKMEKSLLKSVEAIEVDINNTDTLVRQYIRDKKKQSAKNFLRKKHVLEKNLGLLFVISNREAFDDKIVYVYFSENIKRTNNNPNSSAAN